MVKSIVSQMGHELYEDHCFGKFGLTCCPCFQTISIPDVVTAVWDGVRDVRVDIPDQSADVLHQYIHGICGNMDGNPNNDMETGPFDECIAGLPVVPPFTQVASITVHNIWASFPTPMMPQLASVGVMVQTYRGNAVQCCPMPLSANQPIGRQPMSS